MTSEGRDGLSGAELATLALILLADDVTEQEQILQSAQQGFAKASRLFADGDYLVEPWGSSHLVTFGDEPLGVSVIIDPIDHERLTTHREEG